MSQTRALAHPEPVRLHLNSVWNERCRRRLEELPRSQLELHLEQSLGHYLEQDTDSDLDLDLDFDGGRRPFRRPSLPMTRKTNLLTNRL